MIADDTGAIRDAMKKLSDAKALAQAEANRRACADDSKADLAPRRPVLDEPGAPFKGFWLTEDGDIRPAVSFDQDAWDEWDNVTLNADF